MLTGYLATLPTDTLLSAGVLYSARSGANKPIGVTDGAPDFDPGVELGEVMFDNRAPSRLKGLTRRVGFQPVIKGTLKEFGPAASGGQIAVLEPGVSAATVSSVTTETPKPAGALYVAGDYIVDFRWVFERAGGGYACIYAPLAIVRKWSAKGNDKKEGQLAFEIECVGDPVNDLGTGPYAIEIRTQLPATQAQDGSYADVIATATSEGVPLLRFRSARVAVNSGGLVQSVPQVPGMPATGALTAIQDGGGSSHLPTYDAVNGLARTNSPFNPQALVSTWTGDADVDLSKGVFVAFIGAFKSVGASAQCMGFQRASTLAENAVMQGSFANSTLDSFFNTPSSHQYFWNTNWADADATLTLRLFMWRIPAAGGADGALNATPWASTEIVGVEGERMLPHGQFSANQFTAYTSDAYRQFFGGHPSGLVGTPAVNDTIDMIYGDDLLFGAEPTLPLRNALKRYFAARPGTTAQTSTITHLVTCVGDSRMRGNGSSDLAHALPAQLQTALGSNYQVDNRGISGDNWDNVNDLVLGGGSALTIPELKNRIGYSYDTSRSWDWIVIWEGINSFQDTTTYPPSGMTVATALSRLDALITSIRTTYPDKTKVKILVCHETGSAGAPSQPSGWNAGVDTRLAAGHFEAVAAIETGTDVMDFGDVAGDYPDGLHPGDGVTTTVNVVGEIATIIKNAIVAAGG